MAGGQEVGLLALPLVVSLLNLGAPYLFRGLATLERHDSPVLEVYVAICRYVAAWGSLNMSAVPGTLPSASMPPIPCRNLLLKVALLGVLCYHWLGRRVAVLQGQCWEDFVGQELYRFMVMDFLFTLLDTLFGELVWR